MAVHVLPRLVSYTEFESLSDRPGVDLELHFGQVIERGQPSPRHVALQHRIHELLKAILDSSWQVLIEASYRALPEYEARRTDVAVVTAERWKTAIATGSLMGSPELVIEVLSPSNNEGEMTDRAGLCLGSGTVEFWVVDDRSSTITVTTRDDSSVFAAGDLIPLRIADVKLAAVDVFA
jgi:Uma2 family endonuclease